MDIRPLNLLPFASVPLLIGLAVNWPGGQSDSVDSSLGNVAVNTENFGPQIREYIMDNPNIITDAIDKLQNDLEMQQNAQAQSALEENWALLTSNEGGYVAGNPDGDVTVIEFFDYNCGYCRVATPVIMEMLESDPNLRVVFREFPIRGDDSDAIAPAALAAAKQGKYLEIHAAMMQAEGQMTLERFEGFAEDVGVDMDQLREDAADPALQEAIGQNMALAELLYIQGTPSFIVGDQIIRGWPGPDGFKTLIEATRSNG